MSSAKPDPEKVLKEIEDLLKRGHWQKAKYLIYRYFWDKENSEGA